jgi:polysaccharide biosynthesis protein PslH
MRFVWITKENPLESGSGARIYSNGLLRGLLNTGATGTLVANELPGTKPVAVDGLTQRFATPMRRFRAFSLLTNLHSDAYRMKNAEIAFLFRQALDENPDTVVIDYYATGWVLEIFEEVFRKTRKRPVLVYISHNYEPVVRRQVAGSVKNPLMRLIIKLDAEKGVRHDQQLVQAADLVVVNTDEDKLAYLKDAPGRTFVTLTPAYDGEIQPTRPIDESRPRRAVIMGSLDWIAKQMTLRRFLKHAEGPFKSAGIELLVVGRAPQAFIEELAEKHPFCKFTGTVDDVRPYLADARIGIMPDDVGGGFKHKNLYYIFAGLPIATIRSQFAGMPVDTDRDVIAADSIEELVHTVVASIDDIPRLDGMRQRCWDACAKAFDWSDRGRRLRECIDSAMAGRPRNKNGTPPFVA